MAPCSAVPGARLQPLRALHCFAEQGSMGWLGCASLCRGAQLGGPIASSPTPPHCLGLPLLCKVNGSAQSLSRGLMLQRSNKECCSGCLHPLRNGGLEALGAESLGRAGAQGDEISTGTVLGQQAMGVNGAGCLESAVLAAGSRGCTALGLLCAGNPCC